MPTNAPSVPMIASQPWRTAASIPTLTGALPITAPRAASGASDNSSQRGGMLDRVVRRPVLAAPDGVVRHQVDDALAHQRGEPDRRPAIVGEHQERAGERDDPAMQRHAVHGGRHAVLADAVVDEAAGE